MPTNPVPFSSRSQFRPYALDGAMLYFHPGSGTHVRVANHSTLKLRRRAPRVAMFGITNACNLSCEFCSRDTTRQSLWSVQSAAALLTGLCHAGTLEVAFGGGEPFAFRGFADLLEELHATTPLALHVTTNGTLVRESLWRRLRGLLGQVRISIYPDTPWRRAAELFTADAQRWGANLLIDDAMLPGLPDLLRELVALQCHDVSLLSYVGPDRPRQLSQAGEQRLAAIIAESPVPCRLSVCFGDRIPAPRLLWGLDNTGDCGAGYDFVSITPDQRLQSCSFQDHSLPAQTAEDVLAAWQLQRVRLGQPSPRHGCARLLPVMGSAPQLPPVAVWQAFSGNNSGECILVAKFEAIENAEQFIAELIPGWIPDESYSAAWRELFQNEGVTAGSQWGLSPSQLAVIGKSVLALSYDAGDAFPELRALAWKRGAFVVPGGIHVHDKTPLLAVIRCKSSADARALMATPWIDAELMRLQLHGDLLLVTIPFQQRTPQDAPQTLAARKQLVLALAADRPLAAELVLEPYTEAEFIAVKQRLGDDLPSCSRLWVSFSGQHLDQRDAATPAQAFAQSLGDQRACVVANGVLLDPVARRKRLAVLAYRRGGYVLPLEGRRVAVTGRFWLTAPPRRKGKKADSIAESVARLQTLIPQALPQSQHWQVLSDENAWQGTTTATLETEDPTAALVLLGSQATQFGCNLQVWVRDLNPLAWTLRRLIAEVRG